MRSRNIEALKARHPELLKLYESLSSGGMVEPVEAKSGVGKVFRFGSTFFHSSYKPEEEAARGVSNLPASADSVWVFGLGYGWHLRELIKRNLNIVVVEPSLEIFKSSVENGELAEIFEKCHVIVGSSFREKLSASNLANAALLSHRPYLSFFETEFNRLETAFTVKSFLSRKPLKIMLTSPIYGGSETTYRYTADALRRIGAKVLPFDVTPFAGSFFKLENFTKNERHLGQLRSLFSGMLGEAATAFADQERPDIILVMAQSPLDTGVLSRLKGLNVPLAFWFVEDFRTIKYWDRVAPFYDYFFTIQRGEFFEKLGSAGAKNVAYIPQAAAPEVMRPAELSSEDKEKYGSDISFMGAGYKNRQEFFNGLLDYDFKIWGTEWNLSTEVGKRVQNENRRMAPEEYSKVFNASKININLHSSSLLAGIDPVGDFVNPRVFELAACGAFQLVDSRAELEPLMKAGEEIVTFSSQKDLRKKIDYYLKNDDEREKIASAGRKRVLEDHTFDRRLEDILRIIIETKGDKLGERAVAPVWNSRNLVKNIIKEAGDMPELVEFLKKFDQEKVLSVEEVMDEIAKGEGTLSRVESIMQMIDQITTKNR